MQKIQELYVILKDTPGAIGDMCRILKKKNISIFAIGVFIDSARLYVSDTEKASKCLEEHGYILDVRSVLKVNLPNKRGVLMELTTKLGKAGININYLYGALEEKQKRGTLILEVDSPEVALDIFRNHSFE
jgi:hypothetical protein